jgi:hypothetical protein
MTKECRIFNLELSTPRVKTNLPCKFQGCGTISDMVGLHRTRSFCDYLASGIACGLGGMALVCVPLIGVPILWSLSHDWLKQHGFSDLGPATWFWSQVIALLGPLHIRFLFPVALVTLPVVAFIYGWWAGMHRTRDPRAAMAALSRRRAAAT